MLSQNCFVLQAEVKVLIQNILFHRVLGEVKIQASVSSRSGWRSMFYKHLVLYMDSVEEINRLQYLYWTY